MMGKLHFPIFSPKTESSIQSFSVTDFKIPFISIISKRRRHISSNLLHLPPLFLFQQIQGRPDMPAQRNHALFPNLPTARARPIRGFRPSPLSHPGILISGMPQRTGGTHDAGKCPPVHSVLLHSAHAEAVHGGIDQGQRQEKQGKGEGTAIQHQNQRG